MKNIYLKYILCFCLPLFAASIVHAQLMTFPNNGRIDATTEIPAASIAVGDFNGDGYTDVFIPGNINESGNTNRLYINNGSGWASNAGFSLSTPSFSRFDDPYLARAVDVNQNGHLDILVHDFSGVFLLTNDGLGNFSRSTFIDIPGLVFTAIGDIDGDGYQDIIYIYDEFGGLNVNQAVIGRFNPLTKSYVKDNSALNNLPSGDYLFYILHLVDLDNDGLDDLVIMATLSDFSGSDIYIYKNNQNSFSLEYSKSAFLYTNIAFADFDGDLIQDILLGPSSVSDRYLYLKHNGNFNFNIDALDIPVDNNDPFLSLVDGNGDGNIDFLTSYNTVTGHPIFINNGSFNFTKTSFSNVTTANYLPEDFAWVDVDRNGYMDFVHIRNATHRHNVYLGTSTYNWTNFRLEGNTSKMGIGATVVFQAVGGNPQMRQMRYNLYSEAPYQGHNRAYFAQGNASESNVEIRWPGSKDYVSYKDIPANDFYVLREDGTIYKEGQAPIPSIASFTPLVAQPGEIVTIQGAGFSPTPNNNIVLFGGAKATVNAASSTQLQVVVPASANFGKISITNQGYTGESRQSFTPRFLGSGDLSSSTFNTINNVPTTSGTYDVAFGDLTGNGQLEMVHLNYSNSSFTIRSLVSGNYSNSTSFPTPTGAYKVKLADIDNDGKLDIVILNYDNGRLSIYRNQHQSGNISGTSFAAEVIITTNTFPWDMDIADLDGDGKLDIVVANSTNNTVSVFRNVGVQGVINGSSFAARVNYATGNNARGVKAVDLNRDGKPEVIVLNRNSNSIQVFTNNASPGGFNTNSFFAPVSFSTGNEPEYLFVGDADGDTHPDILVAGGSTTGFFHAFKNQGLTGTITASSFELSFSINPGTAPRGIALADLDGDGKPDLALVRAVGTDNLILAKNTSTSGPSGSIQFASLIARTAGSETYGVQAVDVDGDNKPEVILASFGSQTVNIFRNAHPLASEVPSISSFTPTSAERGRNVTISGTNFSTTPAENQVSFNGVAATVSTSTASSITTVIPNTATSGIISVTVNGETATSSTSFTVNPPVAPSSLTAEASSTTSIELNWQDNSLSEERFFIQRSLSSGSGFTNVGEVGAGVTSYSATGLNPSTTYFFRVVANNDIGDSNFSNVASATTENLVVADIGEDSFIFGAFGGTDDDRVTESFVDNLGFVYLTGTFRGTISFPGLNSTLSRTSNGSSDIYLVKMNSDGKAIWLRSFGALGDDSPNSLIVYNNSDVYLSGFVSEITDFSTDGSSDPEFVVGPSRNFLLKLNSDGESIWINPTLTNVFSYQKLAIDEDGNIFFASSSNPFRVIKINPEGVELARLEIQYNNSFGIDGIKYKNGALVLGAQLRGSIDINGSNITSTATEYPDAIIIHLNASSLGLNWVRPIISTNTVLIQYLDIDNDNSVVVLGFRGGSGALISGNQTLSGIPSNTHFMARVNANGQVQTLKSPTTEFSENAYGANHGLIIRNNRIIAHINQEVFELNQNLEILNSELLPFFGGRISGNESKFYIGGNSSTTNGLNYRGIQANRVGGQDIFLVRPFLSRENSSLLQTNSVQIIEVSNFNTFSRISLLTLDDIQAGEEIRIGNFRIVEGRILDYLANAIWRSSEFVPAGTTIRIQMDNNIYSQSQGEFYPSNNFSINRSYLFLYKGNNIRTSFIQGLTRIEFANDATQGDFRSQLPTGLVLGESAVEFITFSNFYFFDPFSGTNLKRSGLKSEFPPMINNALNWRRANEEVNKQYNHPRFSFVTQEGPIIDSFFPRYASEGDQVTLIGSNFDNNFENVLINGLTPLNIISRNDNEIVVEVNGLAADTIVNEFDVLANGQRFISNDLFYNGRDLSFEFLTEQLRYLTSSVSPINLNDSHTFEVWYKGSEDIGSDGMIFQAFPFELRKVGNGVGLWINNGTTWEYYNISDYKVGEWTHLAVARQGNALRLFENGQLISQRESLIPVQSITSISIGGNGSANTPWYFSGLIRDIRIWDVAKTNEEIANNLFTKFNGREEGLRIYLPSFEGSGNVAYSLAGNIPFRNVNGVTWSEDIPDPNADQPLVAPGNLQATAISGTEIRLTWEYSLSNHDGFRIYQSTDPSNIDVRVSEITNKEAREIVIGNLTTGVNYFFTITAFKGEEESTPSNVADAIPADIQLPEVQFLLSSARIYDGRVDLVWVFDQNPDFPIDGYAIYRQEGFSSNTATMSQIAYLSDTAQRFFNDVEVTLGTSYTYAIRTVAGDFQSAFSNASTAEYYYFFPAEIDPINFVPTSQVTVRFDAKKSFPRGDLLGAAKVYMHAGIIVESPDSRNWINVPGEWGVDDGIGEMTPVGDDVWEFSFVPKDYFDIDDALTPFRIGMVFRNADGTRLGKESGDNDIFFEFDRYCQSFPVGTENIGASEDTKITKFFLEEIQYQEVPDECTTYTDRTNLIANLNRGQVYELTLGLGTCNEQFDKSVRIYADWNGDQIFDEAELVAQGGPFEGDLEESVDFLVPADARIGTTRMRIIVSETSAPGFIDPCAQYAFGETLDVTLKIDTERAVIVEPITLGVISKPEVSANSGTSTVSIQISPEESFESGAIFFKGVRSTQFQRAEISGLNSNRLEFNLPNSNMDELGLEFYFSVTDKVNRSQNSANAIIRRQIPSASSVPLQGLRFGSSQADYQILAIPFNSRPVTQQFSELGSYNKTNWRLFTTNASGNAVELNNGFTNFDPGKGYFFIARNSVNISLDGEVPAASLSNPFRINLSPGWNLIGNPYLFSISVNDLLSQNAINASNVAGYNGGWGNAPASLATFQGLAIFNNSAARDLVFNLSGQAAEKNDDDFIHLTRQEMPGAWSQELHAKNGLLEYQLFGVGMHPMASNELDEWDGHTPPRFSDYLEVNHTEIEGFGGNKITRNIVSVSDFYHWKFEVETSLTASPILISWVYPDIEQDFEMVLVDRTAVRVFNMKDIFEYEIPPGSNKYPLEILYGDPRRVAEALSGLEWQIGNPFPNPFISSIFIPFSVPGYQKHFVTLSVYNAMGQRVKVLHSAEMDPGYYELIWDGTDERNLKVSQGMYFIKLQGLENGKSSEVIKKVIMR